MDIPLITSLMNRITHREISRKKLEMARTGMRKKITSIYGLIEIEYSIAEREPQLRISRSKWKTTHDLTQPGALHQGLCHTTTTHYRYTDDGKLAEKQVQIGNLYDRQGIDVHILRFEPPGCWRGRAIEQSHRRYVSWFD